MSIEAAMSRMSQIQSMFATGMVPQANAGLIGKRRRTSCWDRLPIF